MLSVKRVKFEIWNDQRISSDYKLIIIIRVKREF